MDLEYRQYHRDECVTFLKTAEAFGGLSNMAGGYPLTINKIKILTSEALYQACRFPHLPDVQKIIIGQPSPMTAKMKSKPYRKDSRPDWDDLRVWIMYWCLRVKLAQHWEKFGTLLLSTGEKCIVEESYRDQFWGAKPIDANILVGTNMLGRLLMKLRQLLQELKEEDVFTVKPLPISDFLLAGEPIGAIQGLIRKTKETDTSLPFEALINEDEVLASVDVDVKLQTKREDQESSLLSASEVPVIAYLHSSSMPEQQQLW